MLIVDQISQHRYWRIFQQASIRDFPQFHLMIHVSMMKYTLIRRLSRKQDTAAFSNIMIIVMQEFIDSYLIGMKLSLLKEITKEGKAALFGSIHLLICFVAPMLASSSES